MFLAAAKLSLNEIKAYRKGKNSSPRQVGAAGTRRSENW
jgi:hypothetical protein